jgi:hypothetical protein
MISATNGNAESEIYTFKSDANAYIHITFNCLSLANYSSNSGVNYKDIASLQVLTENGW